MRPMKTLLFMLSIAGTIEFWNSAGWAADDTRDAGAGTGLVGYDQLSRAETLFAAAANEEQTEVEGQSSNRRRRQWVKTANAQPQGVPTPASGFHSPTYLEDVVPILLGKCFRCH